MLRFLFVVFLRGVERVKGEKGVWRDLKRDNECFCVCL